MSTSPEDRFRSITPDLEKARTQITAAIQAIHPEPGDCPLAPKLAIPPLIDHYAPTAAAEYAARWEDVFDPQRYAADRIDTCGHGGRKTVIAVRELHVYWSQLLGYANSYVANHPTWHTRLEWLLAVLPARIDNELRRAGRATRTAPLPDPTADVQIGAETRTVPLLPDPESALALPLLPVMAWDDATAAFKGLWPNSGAYLSPHLHRHDGCGHVASCGWPWRDEPCQAYEVHDPTCWDCQLTPGPALPA
ncbi:hypothetical protein [Polymorphospora sp. NPDC050346]|uniref:hypothetical protein n=1 Tax=Polymorphospora sp. NPDC050346 TaxID=3155780 RepID=UPI0033F75450